MRTDGCDGSRMRRLRLAGRAVGVLALTAMLWAGHGSAQPAAPLFASQDALALTLEAPIRTLVNQRARRPEVAGLVTYATTAGERVALEVEVRTRGRSRLEICSFPPLSVNFKRRQVEGTEFAGQNRLKLVTLCRERGDYPQYLELERIAYRILNEVTPASFRVRPAAMRYVDTERDGQVTEAPAFLIEHIDGVAARTGTQAAEVDSIDPWALDPDGLAKVMLFQFLIGNTDFSVLEAAEGDECCHNADVLVSRAEPATYAAVPYDFDQSGFVDTIYAEPSDQLPIRSVTQRLYRGLCSSNDRLAAAIGTFNDARPRIDALLSAAALDEETRARAARFLAAGFDVLNDPAALGDQVIARCRG